MDMADSSIVHCVFFIYFLRRIMFFFLLLKSFIHLPRGQLIRIQPVSHPAGPAVRSLCNIVLCFAGNMRNSYFRLFLCCVPIESKKIKNWNVPFVSGLKNKHNTYTWYTFRAWLVTWTRQLPPPHRRRPLQLLCIHSAPRVKSGTLQHGVSVIYVARNALYSGDKICLINQSQEPAAHNGRKKVGRSCS